MSLHAKMASESVFHAAVRTIFTNWTALQLAIQHGMGGPYAREKERWLADAAVQYFHDNDLQPDEVEEFINDILNNEFDTIADDGSVEEISRKLCQFHRWCQEGHESLVLENLPKSCTTRTGTNSSQCVTEQMQNLSLEHTTNDAPTESTPDSETPLEEGWTVVRRSKNR
ncbi:pre-rRNA-processing protein TSR2 homolog isoform X2 [Limulus polyphemus]|uniref:Pre-rRNA-processing protein TSR2 homolog n=1 Tax=Limulus polyphemus TaxID=6850 RepID=A0ABM1BPV5_LIMPO|nr:pre-rRNA-processing protein TSR2 homolog isoform X2 [Limulus polyphemus]